MLTLKLENTKTGRMRILECAAVMVSREPKLASLTVDIGERQEVIEVHDLAEFNVAYVENACGITTQVIRVRAAVSS